MMGKAQRREPKLFYSGLNLEERVPADHRLRRIKAAVSFAAVRPAVAGRYGHNGHESLDPVLILKLMLLLFVEDVASERELVSQLPLRLDWLWFCEMDLDEAAPDHSVLSKARRRWGLGVFQELFGDVLRQCRAAGLIDGSTVYADSTVLKADASVESRGAREIWEQPEGGREARDGDGEVRPRPRPMPRQDTQAAELPEPPKGPFNAATVSTTDPDAAT